MLLVLAITIASLEITPLFAVAVMAEEKIWDGDVATSYAGGSGTQTDPYLISNGEELAFMAKCVNEGVYGTKYKYFELINDVYLNSSESYDNVWTPIGTSSNTFCGEFQGNGHKIMNLYINSDASYQGLFGCVENGDVKDLQLVDCLIYTC